MFNEENDYSRSDLQFNYLNLKKYLLEMHKQGIDNLNLFLLISLETTYYEGETLKQILLDLKNLSNNLICDFNGEKVKFQVNVIKIDNGDVLNRHRWIYRYCEDYMLKNNLTEEEEIPADIKKNIEDRAYIAGKQQGFNWFKRNLDSFNLLFPESAKLDKNFKLGDEITLIYEGCNKCPRMEYVCYEYWLKNPKYKIMEKAMNEIRNIKNSIIERTYGEESRYFLKRLNNRNEEQKFPEIFIKYSKEYLSDESIKHTLIQDSKNNNFELYYGPEIRHNIIFRSDKVRISNNIIKDYLENELLGMMKKSHITIQKNL